MPSIAVIRLAALAGLAILAQAAPAAAAPQTLKFRLVTQSLSTPVALPEVGGHKITAQEMVGVAVLEDGRLAQKRFIDVSDDTPESGTFRGYSTYTFQNGDSLTLGYTGGWDAKGAGGDYTVISGTGAYAGARGTGSMRAVDTPSWKGANLFDVVLELNVATQ